MTVDMEFATEMYLRNINLVVPWTQDQCFDVEHEGVLTHSYSLNARVPTDLGSGLVF